EPMLTAPVLEGMRACVAALGRADWPAVFAFAYDHFWLAARRPSLLGALRALLGPGCRQTPHVWVHQVGAERGAAGWGPHKDNAGGQQRVTVWIPLSDATLDTGAIGLIPRHRMPPGLQERWYDLAAFDRADVLAMLHAARPIPARAGSAVC